jgi:hypothetical protein
LTLTVAISSPLRGNCTLGLKSMAQVLKPTLVAQADFGRNLKPAPEAKLFVFF